jgi:lipoprotein-releasing system ATP-binding protein
MSKVQSPKLTGRETDVPSGAPAAVARETAGATLVVTDLRKSFLSATGEKIGVLRGVSFQSRAGETVAVMGASGAGKSTLLQILGGLEAADHGSVAFGEFTIDGATANDLARFRNRKIGFVFQFHNLLPDLTAAENVSLPLLIAGASRRQALARASERLAEAGLDSRTSAALVGNLSGGEQQRVAVCRAIINRPGLVLADEPTGNLDDHTGTYIARMLVSYVRGHGALLVVATHNHSLAETCERTLTLREGRLYEAT